MHAPSSAKRFPFPVHLKPWIVAGFEATREELRVLPGEPHYVETDSTRTFGGDEDNWAWELPTGQRVLIVRQVPYQSVLLYSDPPDATAVIEAIGIDAEKPRLQIEENPIVDPQYSGP